MPASKHTPKHLHRLIVFAGAILLIGLSSAARALAEPNLVDLSVVDRDTGQVLRTWRRDGRLFLAGETGARYGLRVVNHTDDRVLVVLSVDGVNVLTGETASFGQRGYVFNAHQSYDVDGWRKSQTEIAAFVFAPLPQSYAARTGRTGDVGVIGMAVFKERVAAQSTPAVNPDIEPERPRLSDRRASDVPDAPAIRGAPPPPVFAPPPPIVLAPAPAPIASPAPQIAARSSMAAGSARTVGDAALRPQDEKLGTAHGAQERSVTNMVAFERATAYPQTVRQIEYDTYDHLVANGVISPSDTNGHRPHAFPPKPDGTGYVPDPPGRP